VPDSPDARLTAAEVAAVPKLNQQTIRMLAFPPPTADPHIHWGCNGVATGRRERGTEPAVAPSLRTADQEARQVRVRQAEVRRSAPSSANLPSHLTAARS
jgi:hypothetical protein